MARGRPIVVEWAANVRDFLSGTSKVERSVEDIADELKDATKESGRFEDRFTADMRKAEQASGQTARNIEDDFGEAPGKLGDIGRDAGSEFVSNIGESVSSGDVSNIVADVAGGVLSGLEGTFGYATAGVGAVILGGWGLIRQKAEEEQARQEEAYDRWVDKIIEERGRLSSALDAAAIEDSKKEFMAESPEEFIELVEAASALGVNTDLVLRARVGDVEAIQELNGLVDEQMEKEGALAELTGESLDNWTTIASILPDAEASYADVERFADAVNTVETDRVTSDVADGAVAAEELADNMDDTKANTQDAASASSDLDTNLGDTVDPASDVATETQRIADNLARIDGKTFRATLVIAPGDAYTRAALDLTGP